MFYQQLKCRRGGFTLVTLIIVGVLMIPVVALLSQLSSLTQGRAMVSVPKSKTDLRRYFEASFSCVESTIVAACANGIGSEQKLGKFNYRYECRAGVTGKKINVQVRPQHSSMGWNRLFVDPIVCPNGGTP